MAPKRRPLAERFWPKVDRRGPNECWPWLAALNGPGYGQISPGGRGATNLMAHRVAYEFLVGPIPNRLHIDHLCRNPRCVNPAHLEPVTHRVNMQRGEKAQRTHCIHGHEFTPENTVIRPNGTRRCRACHNKRDRERGRKHHAHLA